MAPDVLVIRCGEEPALRGTAGPGAHTLAMLLGALFVGSLLTSGCDEEGDVAPPDALFTLRDSAGLVVAESSGVLWEESPHLRWTVDTMPLLQLGEVEDSLFARVYPVAAAVRLEDGRLAVAGQRHTILWYGEDGSYLFEGGRQGDGPGERRSVAKLVATGADSIAVYDASRRRWVMFDGAGNPQPYRLSALDCSLLKAARGPDGRWLGWCVRIRRGGDLTTGAAGARGGALELSAGGSQGGASESLHEYRLLAVTQDGTRLDTVAVLVVPRPYTISAAPVFAPVGSEILLGDAHEHALTALTPEGVPVRSIRWAGEDLTVPLADHTRWRPSAMMMRDARVQITSQPYDPNLEELRREAFARARLPERKGAYRGVVGDPDGALWVQLNRFYDDPEIYSVLTPEGRYLGEVTMPRNLHVTQIGRDFVLGLWWDEDTDLEFVRLYRLLKP